jgi:hypothetical protein
MYEFLGEFIKKCPLLVPWLDYSYLISGVIFVLCVLDCVFLDHVSLPEKERGQ